ncbi:uncharacterized protein N7496_010407 [Penicillium cataractarum]|uniref:Uncharacterized protein n=1 Tax=Penicillium cataractarum TaxID=2100454 RepID=A0A9W9RSX9_9EURO|nr:uncharacterized protein N7496_010407 [Penicillium cataractarum]KAJ5364694.1 hypothetical protein N7496_010407 [Penicillium cataractarum]
MAWSMIDMSWQGDQVNYDEYHMVDFSQAQTQERPMSSNSDWKWTGDARTASPTTWNAVSTPQAMPTAGENCDWNTLSSTNAVNAIWTGVENPTPNSGLDYFPRNTAALFSHTDRISPGAQSMVFPGQASREEIKCNPEVDHRVLITRPHARLPNRIKKNRRIQPYVISEFL